VIVTEGIRMLIRKQNVLTSLLHYTILYWMSTLW